MHRFRARLRKAAGSYVVDVPAKIGRAILAARPADARGLQAVVGEANGAAFHATLIPRRGGTRHFVRLNARVRREAGAVAEGEAVAVKLDIDRSPPSLPVPDDLVFVLRDEGCLEAFESMPRGKKNHIIEWIDRAVQDDTRAKRIAQTLEVAQAAREKAIDRAPARSQRERRNA